MKASSFSLNRNYSGEWIFSAKLTPASVQEAARLVDQKSTSSCTEWEVTVKEWRERRSRSANAYFHTLCNKLAAEMQTDTEWMKKEMVLRYGVASDAVIRLPNGVNEDLYYPYCKWIESDGETDTYVLYKQTHLLDSKEFSVLLNGVVDECKTVGIETLPPEELERLYALAYKTHGNPESR